MENQQCGVKRPVLHQMTGTSKAQAARLAVIAAIAFACTLALVSTASLAVDRTGCSEFLASVAATEAAKTAAETFEKRPHPFSSVAELYNSPEGKAWRDKKIALTGALMEAYDRTTLLALALRNKITDETTKQLLYAHSDFQVAAANLSRWIFLWRKEKNAFVTSPELDFDFPAQARTIFIGVLKKACALGLVRSGK